MQDNKRDKSVIEEYLMYFFMWTMGWFPSVVSKPLMEVAVYNVKDEVERVLRQGQSM